MNSIWGIGRNYQDHVTEMKTTPSKFPLVFLKPFAAQTQDKDLSLPSDLGVIHYELELAVQVNAELQPSQVTLALDLTAREQQNSCKKQGKPWTIAKGFKNSCALGPWQPYQGDSWWQKLTFSLHKNDQVLQQGKTSDMIFSLPKLIEYLTHNFPVQDGDIILTGTPSGVGPFEPGDQLRTSLEGASFCLWNRL